VLAVSVVQRSREIGILRAMGTTRGMVVRIFLWQGATVGLLGSVLGSGLGAALSALFQSLTTADGGGALFPIDLSPSRLIAASVVATLTGLLAAVAPARRAARLDPAVAMRSL
jgi:lipoprotein-releasing system permease protein